MRVQKRMFIVAVLTLALALTVAGARTNISLTNELAHTAEAEAVGGYSCALAFGLGVSLGVAALSGCGILCGTAAWYTLLALSACD